MQSYLLGILLLTILVVIAAIVMYRRLGRGTDILWPELPDNLQFSDVAATEDALAKIYAYAMGFSNSSVAWYQSRRRPKRKAGFMLRVGALLATVAAGLVPLSKEFGIDGIPAVTSTLLLALAGLFVSVDSLGGFTSGWVRYMLAQQKIERSRDAFLMEWNALKLASNNAQALLDRVKAYLLTVGKVVDDETQEWATEFQNALKELDRARKAEAEKPRTGAIEITVTNPHVVKGWALEIDGSLRGRATGKALAVTDVLVGMRKARIYGEDPQGRTLSDEKILNVEGGGTVARELVLS